mmetsp:Transcript_20880/g.61785  ORF Transcript_20880/g.61785 Transcript_20880/m.61785 type:complete len:439 (-) Transcript_20880:434-1750(-)
MPITLRLRTKDGTERVSVEPDVTLDGLLDLVAAQLGLDRQEISVTKDGPGREPLEHAGPIGLRHGDMVFLHYHREREALAKYEERDPFKRLATEGALRKQGAKEWTLTSYLDYRAQREFKLGKLPDPHCLFVSVDPAAGHDFLANMQSVGFACQRLGLLYGRFTEDGGVQVDAIYEPLQECTDASLKLMEDPGESKAHQVASLLGLAWVGWIFAHPPRAHAFTIDEVTLAAQLHARALDLAEPPAPPPPEPGAAGRQPEPPENPARRFVTLKARLVVEGEAIEGVATVEAYQMTDQCVDLVRRKAFKQSSTDPRCAKTVEPDCFFIMEQKESRKATAEHFVTRIHDMSRAYSSPLQVGFPVENRPATPQSQQALRDHLVRRRGEPFHLVAADFHFLLFAANLLDMKTDMPVFCQAVAEGDSSQLEGFRLMLNTFADID